MEGLLEVEEIESDENLDLSVVAVVEGLARLVSVRRNS